MRTRTPTSSEGGRDETEDGYGKQHHITDRDHVSLNSTINLVLTELYPSRPSPMASALHPIATQSALSARYSPQVARPGKRRGHTQSCAECRRCVHHYLEAAEGLVSAL